MAIRIKKRVAHMTFILSGISEECRGEFAENLICAKLNSFGLSTERVKGLRYTDIMTNGTLPVQVKSISLKKHGWEVLIDDSALKGFEGFYVILFEYEPEDVLLYFGNDEMRQLMSERGKQYKADDKARLDKGPRHKGRWRLYIPRSLEGFSQYLSTQKLIEAAQARKHKG